MFEHMFLLYNLSVNKFRKALQQKNKGEHTMEQTHIV